MASWEANKIISYFLYKLLLCFSPSTWPIRTNNIYYSGTPPYGHLGNMVTLLLRPLFFGHLTTKTIHFLVKKSSLIWSPCHYSQFFLAHWWRYWRGSTVPTGLDNFRKLKNGWSWFLPFLWLFILKQTGGVSNEREVFRRGTIFKR